jgi:very-short-patch-repair endonuclease
MEGFDFNLNDLLGEFKTSKQKLYLYLQKHFIENIHYEKRRPQPNKQGGQNRIDFYLRKDVFELIKTTYNLKHRYVTKVKNVNQVQTIMSLENQTIGFITAVLDGIVEVKRQHKVGKFFVDLYIPSINLVLECDEWGHKDRDKDKENERERFIFASGFNLLRFNPNDSNFDIAFVLNTVIKQLV